MLAEASVNLLQALHARRPARQPSPSIQPWTAKTGGRLELQVPLGRVSAEVVLQRPLDVDGWVSCPSIRLL
jgi:hypothetical protein